MFSLSFTRAFTSLLLTWPLRSTSKDRSSESRLAKSKSMSLASIEPSPLKSQSSAKPLITIRPGWRFRYPLSGPRNLLSLDANSTNPLGSPDAWWSVRIMTVNSRSRGSKSLYDEFFPSFQLIRSVTSMSTAFFTGQGLLRPPADPADPAAFPLVWPPYAFPSSLVFKSWFSWKIPASSNLTAESFWVPSPKNGVGELNRCWGGRIPVQAKLS